MAHDLAVYMISAAITPRKIVAAVVVVVVVVAALGVYFWSRSRTA